MTPKEEAWQIVEEHFKIINKKCTDILDAKMMRKDSFLKSKLHSLITVNQIIEVEIRSGIIRTFDNPLKPKQVDLRGNARGESYWQEVKKEIENL